MTTGQCNTNLEANVKTEVCRRTNRTILLRKRMRVKKGEKMIPGAGGWGQTREVEAIDFYRSLLAQAAEGGYLPTKTYLPTLLQGQGRHQGRR
jgi:hypothetical protein